MWDHRSGQACTAARHARDTHAAAQGIAECCREEACGCTTLKAKWAPPRLSMQLHSPPAHPAATRPLPPHLPLRLGWRRRPQARTLPAGSGTAPPLASALLAQRVLPQSPLLLLLPLQLPPPSSLQSGCRPLLRALQHPADFGWRPSGCAFAAQAARLHLQPPAAAAGVAAWARAGPCCCHRRRAGSSLRHRWILAALCPAVLASVRVVVWATSWHCRRQREGAAASCGSLWVVPGAGLQA